MARPRQIESYGTSIGFPKSSAGSRLCRLAFVESPLPDELLGSWLARLSVLNGILSALRFFELFGEKKQIHQYNLTDVTGTADHLIQAAESLGISSLVAVRELSLRPFRSCFLSDPSCSVDDVELINVRFQRKLLRVCPVCLREDDASSFPYLHRSHQLDGSHVCHKHRVYLRSWCDNCRRPIYTTNDFSVPTLRCQCGSRHTAVSSSRGIKDPWWRLAVFESDALSSPPGTLFRPHVAPVLKSLLSRATASEPSSFRDLLLRTFGERGLALLQNPLVVQMQSTPAKKRLHGLMQVSPTILSAFFVALGFDFSTAVSEVDRFAADGPIFESKPPRTLVSRVWRASRPADVEDARAVLARAIEEGKVRNHSDARQRVHYAYWLLRMRDANWLAAQFHAVATRGVPNAKIPTIQADRKTLLERPILSVMSYQDARVRAYYRDHRWLGSQMLVPALQIQHVPRHEIAISEGMPLSLAQAKRHLSTLVNSGTVRTRRQLRRKRRLLFWYLAINDLKWLCDRIKSWPNTPDLIVVPSRTHDRRLVNAPDASGDLLTDATIRARIRDHVWYVKQQRQQQQREAAIEVQRLVAELIGARNSFISGANRPGYWCVREASRLLGLSRGRLYDLAKREPQVRELLQISPARGSPSART